MSFQALDKDGVAVALLTGAELQALLQTIATNAGSVTATQPVSITGTVPVSGTVAVTGTFFQATQPVSGTVAVTGTFFQATQPVSAASLPLPAGAATAANQATMITSLATLATATAGVPLPAGTDRSGSITAGGTAQTIAAANASRVGMTIQNTSDTTMSVTENGVTATATNGFLVGAGVAINISTNKLVSVFCATTGKTFAATEY